MISEHVMLCKLILALNDIDLQKFWAKGPSCHHHSFKTKKKKNSVHGRVISEYINDICLTVILSLRIYDFQNLGITGPACHHH